MKKAFFFDMDGVIFNSMPHHAIAWEETMHRNGFSFSQRDTYLNEGRTGQSVIAEAARMVGRSLSEQEIWSIYHEKTERFHSMGDPDPIPGIAEVLRYLHDKVDIWIVTGSGQQSLFARLDHCFPGIFSRDRMVTAFDVKRGKPDPEPYLIAWERSGYDKSECCVVENAPMGVEAGHAAGLFTIGVNTGPLDREDLLRPGADRVMDDMYQLLQWLQDGNLDF